MSKKIFSRIVAISLAAAVVVSGCYVQDASAAPKAPKLSLSKKTIEVGSTTTIKINKKGIKIKKTTWKTSKKKVASISKAKKTSVKVTGKKKGSAKITATVKYTAGSKSATKKLTCKVKVADKKVDVVVPTNTPAGVNPTNGPIINEPTAVPTVAPTEAPYYYDYDYFALFNGDKASGKENLYIDFVISDSWQTNTRVSAIESLDFQLDTEESFDIDIYVTEWHCDIATNATKIATISTDGTMGQNISLTSQIKGNQAISRLDSTNNGRISFGFAPTDGKGQFIIHDMYVNYWNNNKQHVSHHQAAISVVTAGIGSAATKYQNDKNAGGDSFKGTLEGYVADTPEGLFITRHKDASAAINDYTSMAELTAAKGYKFGTCVTYNQLVNDPEFCKLLAHHCDSITAMNEFKAYSLLDGNATRAAFQNDETSMPVMNYEKADYICEWAQENGLQIRGHALVWDNAMVQWFFTKGYQTNSSDYASNDICRKRLRYYIDEVMRHFQEKYPDVVYCWDVVNEGIDENSGDPLKIRTHRGGENYFYYHCGSGNDNYVRFTFQCAYDTREAMINEGLLTDRSKIELVYNDYNVIESNKRPHVKNLVQNLNSGGIQLVDAVGCQGYLGAYQKQQGCLSIDWVNKTTTTIKEFSSMNPPVHVQLTEMAMRNFDWDYLDDHGTFAANLFNGLANINQETNNSFTSMSMWAFIDDPIMNKVDESFDYWQYAPFSGMFDDVYRVKPAFVNAFNILSE